MNMALSLKKGEKLSLTKEAPSMTKCIVGLGWDARATAGADFDLDASAFLLDASGKCRSEADFIFYNQPKSTCGSVQSTGDNRTGSGDGDDEQIKVDLAKVPADVQKIAFTVTIYDFEARRQNFGQVSNAYIRLVDETTGKEVCRFDLSEQYSTETAIVFAEIYRKDNEWKFNAVGQGYAGGLGALNHAYGLNVN
jgi:tellurium resistance protein TerD